MLLYFALGGWQFQCPKLLRLTGVHAAELRLPGVDRVLRHTTLSGYVVRCTASLYLIQSCNNLRFAVLAPAHAILPQIRNHTSVCADLGKQVTGWSASCAGPSSRRRIHELLRFSVAAPLSNELQIDRLLFCELT